MPARAWAAMVRGAPATSRRDPGAPLVQGPAGAFSQVGVDRFADQIMPERQPGPVVFKEAGADCLADTDGHLGGWMLRQQRRHVPRGQRLTKHGGDGHQLSRGRAEFSEAATHAEHEFGRDVEVGDVLVLARITPSRICVAKNGSPPTPSSIRLRRPGVGRLSRSRAMAAMSAALSGPSSATSIRACRNPAA